ncbi:cell division protein ZapE [Bradyrhizobium sp. NFR13]|uniref:cell division protein ZapE n=1 Tax=Bradyrhizobium sp. NFR13 TaxID=1566285 RepID=UPI0008E33D75|nr:cell division protein ZapE [Bradyrhizobium sp. NFR13]SFL42449.1 cell division protein ZapE [Bradyrhizobium sp. NFR13]
MSSSPPKSFREQYQALIASGAIEADPAQAGAVEAIAALDAALSTYKPPRKQGFFGRLFGDKDMQPPRGLYVHGEVGRGKTMLMDLFFEASAVTHKRRAHFHEFMADTHERIYNFRQKIASGEIPEGDVIALTANSIFDEAWLLCFDEFHVTDIADAMILGRLFARLFELGTVVFATSNVEPVNLYKGGLNRALFLPFIKQIEDHMDVRKLDSRTDFRMEKLVGVKSWLVPDDDASKAALDAAWAKLTGGAPGRSRDLAVKGRKLHVSLEAQGVARFTFSDLCEKPLGASDYLKLAHEYHTLFIEHVPMMDYANRNAAKRFISLIDTMYDNAVKLMATAAAEPPELYSATEGVEKFEFVRTASRLFEMGSETYLALPHGRSDSTASGATTGLVET